MLNNIDYNKMIQDFFKSVDVFLTNRENNTTDSVMRDKIGQNKFLIYTISVNIKRLCTQAARQAEGIDEPTSDGFITPMQESDLMVKTMARAITDNAPIYPDTEDIYISFCRVLHAIERYSLKNNNLSKLNLLFAIKHWHRKIVSGIDVRLFSLRNNRRQK